MGKVHRLKLQPMFSVEASQTEWREPFDFPTRISGFTVADPGEGPGGPTPPFLDETEAQRAEKRILRLTPPPSRPPYLRVQMTGPPSPLT